MSAELDMRLQALEQELQILKNQIQVTLLGLQEQIAANRPAEEAKPREDLPAVRSASEAPKAPRRPKR